MANTNAPFGFRCLGRLNGSGPNFGVTSRLIKSDNSTAIYKGDPVTSLTTGYIGRSSVGTTQIAGIFWGCKYYSPTAGRTVWSPYWPGSGNSGDAEAFVIDDPAAVFEVQAGGSSTTPVAFANIQENINFGLGTGNATTGISGAYVDVGTFGTTSTLPFRIIDVITAPPGANGTDVASAYNRVKVTFNWQDYRSTTGFA